MFDTKYQYIQGTISYSDLVKTGLGDAESFTLTSKPEMTFLDVYFYWVRTYVSPKWREDEFYEVQVCSEI
jgi:hypothetical protein